MRKLKFAFLVFLPFLFANCSGQQPAKNDLFLPEFKWKLSVPEFLITENTQEWERVQAAGRKAMADTYNTAVNNKVKTIFIFKSRDNSFFEAVSEPISKQQADNYTETCERMNDITYNTIKAQVPTAQVDTTKGIELIDNLPFQVLKVRLAFPNGLTKTSVLYRRVFNNTELTVSAMYSNQDSGDNIVRAFKASKFGVDK